MSQSASSKIVAAISYCVIHTALWIGLLFLLAAVVPRYTQILDDFNTEMPVVTQLVVQAGQIVSGYWHLFLLLGVALTAVDFVCLMKLGQAGGAGQSLWGLALALVLLGAGVVAFLGVWMPLTRVLQGLQ